jgi:hypothetical protein
MGEVAGEGRTGKRLLIYFLLLSTSELLPLEINAKILS